MNSTLKWQKELEIFNDIKTSFILEGNIYDIYPNETEYGLNFCEIDEYLNSYLKKIGFSKVIFFDPLHGFYNRFEEIAIDNIFSKCGCDIKKISKEKNNYLGITYRNCTNGSNEEQSIINWASEMIKESMTSDLLIAFVMSFASRYCDMPDSLAEEERYSFLNIMYGSLNAHRVNENGLLKKSVVFMIVDKLNDVPSWFFINNPYFKNISIPLPDSELRRQFINYIQEDFVGLSELADVEKNLLKDKLQHLTEGMRCVEINGLANLCEKENLHIDTMDDAVTLYKYGIKENPWEAVPKELLSKAESVIRERVKGQDAAIIRAVDIIKRAAGGMSGLQHSSSKSRPRGIMFFAGPTGVGKTELAKSIAELLFKDENNCIRFDMSEYAQAQSDQKLFGAPPGYVGYEAGGQLTNAVREKPFSILLFDEIEKAHPSIWDKFLQVLDDGRMTDGQGNTIYFSETIIIFTSNLGIYLKDEYGRKVKNVSPDDSYEELESKVMFGIKEYFNSEQGKPEILNRIGNNIIVFKYINKESAREILVKQLDGIRKYLFDVKKVKVDFDDVIERVLEVAMVNIENGGRGIGNIVEEYVINPLNRVLYERERVEDKTFKVIDFIKKDGVVQLEFSEE